MSSNYRIFLYFLSTLDESLKVGLGLRGTQNLYSRLQRQNGKSQTKQLPKPISKQSSKNTNLKLNLDNLIESSSIVVEGLKQYANYTATHAGKIKYRPNVSSAKINQSNVNISKQEMGGQVLNSQLAVKHNITSRNETVKPTKLESSENSLDDMSSFISNQTNPEYKTSLADLSTQAELSERSKERKVPSNRASRVFSFGGLAFRLGVGAVEELTKRMVGASSQNQNDSIIGSSIFLSESNAIKIVDTLCRVRGAALKLGQMLSIQDNEMLGPELQSIFERVRQSADYMPQSQMHKMLNQELGQEWKSLFRTFDNKPFAAASIGQVHRAELHDGTLVAVKIQYPGVAESIESDIKNVLMILKYANIFPEGLFIDHIMAYAKKELSWEVDYVREADCAIKYRQYILDHCSSEDNFQVPIVYKDLSTKKVLTTKLITGIPIDKLNEYVETSDPRIKNSVLERILKLFFKELFVFEYMQTDPNWSNFYYDFKTDTISLIDFGSSRPYSKQFINQYMDIIKAAINNDHNLVLQKSEEIGFLSGYESDIFKKAHIESVMIIGDAIRDPGKFDFGKQSVIKKIHNLVPVMLRHRLKPPPEEIYSLHRKLSGLFLLFTKLKAEINCRKIFEEVTSDFKY